MTKFISRFKSDVIYLEIVGSSDDVNLYLVEFIDLNTNIVEYSNYLKVNYWAKIDNILNKNVTIRVTFDNSILFERNQNEKYNKVFINIVSTALGDTIAWIPYADEYRKLHNVDVVVYTNHNYLFDKSYPNLIFTDVSDPNEIIDVDKRFKIDYGPELAIVDNVLNSKYWYIINRKYDNCVEFIDYRKHSLQSIACILLGLPDVEVVPKVNTTESKSKINGKYVTVAIQSTAQLKYWNNPFGWDSLFDYLGKNGYKIVLIDKHKIFGVPGSFNKAPKSKYVIDKTNSSFDDAINYIKYADMMITISSGLSWLSWAIGTPVIMISGFTKPFNEFNSNIIRIHDSSVCNGCWHDANVTFNPLDWNYCPKKNNFVCTKVIQPKTVIDAVKKFMK